MTKNIAPVIDPAICPLCGNSNACQMCNGTSAAAQQVQVQAPCWCVEADFPPGLLDRLPESAKGKACICANCVAQARKAARNDPAR